MARFTTTNWSVILQAGQTDSERARHALEQICQRYWYPLYAYVRRTGYDPHSAEDATQSFFLHLLDERLVARANPAEGKFRSFLLVCLQNHLASQRKRDQAQKRGGGRSLISLDETAAETRFAAEPADERSPEALYERSWALNLLEQAFALVEGEYRSAGREPLFRQIQPVLLKEDSAPVYREIATAVGMSEGAVKTAVHRMRQRYREILTGLAASTLSDPAEVEHELKYLLRVLSRP
ncbi:MAG TPA: hypothetical protein VHH88_07430 [Verrucomicrobiae bacterium]|nr:hypothetical protein [Verrucomicrobiae bacterium]